MTVDDQAQDAHDGGHWGSVGPDILPSTTASAGWKPTLVIVSGPPGSGKTTLARQLAQALGCPLLSRDEINEGIFHTFKHDLAIAGKDSVAKLAFDAFFRTIELLLSSRVSIVAEAAFQDYRWRLGLEHLAHLADIKIIHCEIEPELAWERLRSRRLGPDSPGMRRAAQARQDRRPDQPAGGFQQLSLPVPVLRVTTTDGYEPGLNEIVEFVRADK